VRDDQSIQRDILAAGKTAPRITPADIEANIVSEPLLGYELRTRLSQGRG
jgi:hypothetical protein